MIRFGSNSHILCTFGTRQFVSSRGLASLYDPKKPQPAPPRLSDEDQAEFERLVRQAQTQRFVETGDQKKVDEAQLSLHPQFRKPYADFEGEVNPETGEIGGPKQDPLRHGDYSFNGRVTDF